MNKINKVRKGEVRIYKGMTYVAVPEIKEDHCTGCCFYNEGSCLIRDPDHVDFPDCHDSGMIWMQKEINISDIKEKAIKLAIDAMKPIPICSSPCYSMNQHIITFVIGHNSCFSKSYFGSLFFDNIVGYSLSLLCRFLSFS